MIQTLKDKRPSIYCLLIFCLIVFIGSCRKELKLFNLKEVKQINDVYEFVLNDTNDFSFSFPDREIPLDFKHIKIEYPNGITKIINGSNDSNFSGEISIIKTYLSRGIISKIIGSNFIKYYVYCTKPTFADLSSDSTYYDKSYDNLLEHYQNENPNFKIEYGYLIFKIEDSILRKKIISREEKLKKVYFENNLVSFRELIILPK